MITINRNNPTPGEITSSLTNSADGGQGLHFDGAAGNIDIASPPDLGTKFSFEFIVQADAWEATGTSGSFLIDFHSSGNRFYLANVANYSSYNLGIIDNGSIVNFGVSVLDDLKVHHLVMTVDGTTAKLYDNGNQVGNTLTISASHDIDDSTALKIGIDYAANSQWAFDGIIYRARLWNKSLTAAEVTASYENATVPFADQYGSQTIVIPGDFDGNLDGWDTANTWNSQTNPDNNMVLAASASPTVQACRTGTTLTAGKRYRCTYTATSITDAPKFAFWETSSTYPPITADTGSSTITAGTNSFEFVWPAASGNDYFYILNGTATAAVTLDDISVVAAGCVADYDLAFSNPARSFMVPDRAGVADGEASNDGTNPTGIEQVTPIEQLNAKAARIGTSAATPADGDLLVSGNVGVGLGAGLPSRELEVSGPNNVYIRVTAENADDSTALELNNTGGTWTIKNDDSTSETLTFGNSGGTHLSIDSSGDTTLTGSLAGTSATFSGQLTAQSPIVVYGGTATAASIQLYGGTGTTANDNSSILSKYSLILDADSTNSISDRSIHLRNGGTDKLVVTDTSTTVNTTLDVTGLCSFSAGIAFQSATSSTESGVTGTGYTLDKYEEGSWTPVNSAAGSSSGTWDTTLAGKYTRVGDMVTVGLKITGATMDFSSSSGYRTYSGLPFTAVRKSGGACATMHAASFGATNSVGGTDITIIAVETGSGTSQVDATATYFV